MKPITKLIIIVLITATSCEQKLSDHYRGYVFNYNNEPLSGVKVSVDGFPSKYTHTNKKGYFSLKRRSSTFVDDLIFEKNGYNTDTVYSFFANRRRDKTHFLEQRSDTLFMKKLNEEYY
ncbi:carboxypeptidase-like regulatory domain-containing protein [Fulvivirga sediminis]|uniref:Carboxypeptidase-like regulatory domain-containing protein n=1 Tax=Fulvivirga sediminis TaxID=2803949 RepID=A0A937F6X1_9BACT|nr:carboxypeptidase-like regulatory domain-containing protein [Fulvivirga sediminis]MBL3657557.1 carboxypeptidase-like regulatory domain-containing protein [Fulvivirga sediminis]